MASFFKFLEGLIKDNLQERNSHFFKYNESHKKSILQFINENYVTKEMKNEKEFFNISDSRGKLCGYAFQHGDLVYRCKNCGRDPTCVLCVRCFNYEDHPGHEISYSITSGSGGCCDCGDTEAWKYPLKCSYHKLNENLQASNGPTTDTDSPGSMISGEGGIKYSPARHPIAKEFMDIILTLILLNFYENEFIDEPISCIQDTELYFPCNYYSVVVYNDENHDYKEVIDILNQSLLCSRSKCKDFVEKIDKKGRYVVFSSSDKQKCIQVLKSIKSINMHATLNSSLYVCLQEICFVFLKWVVEQCALHPWLQHVLSYEFLQPASPLMISNFSKFNKATKYLFEPENCKNINEHVRRNVDLILIHERNLWKTLRIEFKQLFMNTLLKSYNFKYQLTSSFSNIYSFLLSEFLHQDREPNLSIIFFTVQLYTVPSIIQALIKKERLFQNLFEAITKNFTHSAHMISFPSKSLKFNISESFMQNRRYFHPFQDIRYAINGASFSDILYQKNEVFHKILDFFSVFQDMDTISQATVNHVEFENDDWIHAFNVSLQLSHVSRDLSLFCSTSASVLACSIKHIYKYLNAWFQKINTKRYHSGQTLPLSGGSFSFHHPLHWLFSFLLKCVQKFKPKYNLEYYLQNAYNLCRLEKAKNTGIQNPARYFDEEPDLVVFSPLELLERLALGPLEVQIYGCHIRSGLWVRNGISLQHQLVHNYLGIQLMDDMRNLDLHLLQCYLELSCQTPDVFICRLVQSYGLESFFEDLSSSSNQEKHFNNDKTLVCNVLEDYLMLVIYLISEDLAGEFSEERLVERVIIHCLFLESLSYTKLKRKIPSKLSESPCFDECLSQVSSMQVNSKSLEANKTLYKLKEEVDLSQIDIYYPYYTVLERENVWKVYQGKIKPGQYFNFNNQVNNSRLENLIISKALIQSLFYCLLVLMIYENPSFWIFNKTLYILLRLLKYYKTLKTPALKDPLIENLFLVKYREQSPEFPFATFYELLLWIKTHTKLLSENGELANKALEVLNSLNPKTTNSLSKEGSFSALQTNNNGNSTSNNNNNISQDSEDRKKRKLLAQQRKLKIIENYTEIQKKFLTNITQEIDDFEKLSFSTPKSSTRVLDDSDDGTGEKYSVPTELDLDDNTLGNTTEDKFYDVISDTDNPSSDSTCKESTSTELGLCVICHEPLASSDKSKIIGYLGKISKTKLFRNFNFKSVRSRVESKDRILFPFSVFEPEHDENNNDDDGELGSSHYSNHITDLLNPQRDLDLLNGGKKSKGLLSSSIYSESTYGALTSSENEAQHISGEFDSKENFNILDSWEHYDSNVLTICRHVFHYECYKLNIKTTTLDSVISNLYFRDFFKCPLCRKRGNCFIPVKKSFLNISLTSCSSSSSTFSELLTPISMFHHGAATATAAGTQNSLYDITGSGELGGEYLNKIDISGLRGLKSLEFVQQLVSQWNLCICPQVSLIKTTEDYLGVLPQFSNIIDIIKDFLLQISFTRVYNESGNHFEKPPLLLLAKLISSQLGSIEIYTRYTFKEKKSEQFSNLKELLQDCNTKPLFWSKFLNQSSPSNDQNVHSYEEDSNNESDSFLSLTEASIASLIQIFRFCFIFIKEMDFIKTYFVCIQMQNLIHELFNMEMGKEPHSYLASFLQKDLSVILINFTVLMNVFESRPRASFYFDLVRCLYVNMVVQLVVYLTVSLESFENSLQAFNNGVNEKDGSESGSDSSSVEDVQLGSIFDGGKKTQRVKNKKRKKSAPSSTTTGIASRTSPPTSPSDSGEDCSFRAKKFQEYVSNYGLVFNNTNSRLGEEEESLAHVIKYILENLMEGLKAKPAQALKETLEKLVQDPKSLVYYVMNFSLAFLRKAYVFYCIFFNGERRKAFSSQRPQSLLNEFKFYYKEFFDISKYFASCGKKVQGFGTTEIEEGAGILQLIVDNCLGRLGRELSVKGSKYYFERDEIVVKIDYPFPYQLIQIPKYYDTLVQKSLRIPCKTCNKVPLEVAICMICGKLCCFQSYCCGDSSVGEYSSHSLQCGISYGIFLVVNKGTTLLVSNSIGYSRAAPYVDKHNETDQGLKRGNPLYLSQQMMAELRHAWITHGVYDNINAYFDADGTQFRDRLWIML